MVILYITLFPNSLRKFLVWHFHTLTNITSRCVCSDLNEVPAVGMCVSSQWGEIHIVDSLAPSQCCRVSYPPFSGPPWSSAPIPSHTACVQTTDRQTYKGPGLVSSANSTGVLLTALHKNPTTRSVLAHGSLLRSHMKTCVKYWEIISVCLSGAFFIQKPIGMKNKNEISLFSQSLPLDCNEIKEGLNLALIFFAGAKDPRNLCGSLFQPQSKK